MKLDLLPPNTWENFCTELKSQIALPQGAEGVRAYHGISHGLYESLVSLAQLYPHKRSITVVEGVTPYFLPILKHFSKEGYDIERMPPQSLSEAQWSEKLGSDCLFVLYACDHVITGERFDMSPLEIAGAQKRIFTIGLSHYDWKADSTPALGKFSLRLCSLNPNLCLLVHGARFKAAPILAHHMFWSAIEIENLLSSIQAEWGTSASASSKTTIEHFESRLPGDLKPLLSPATLRSYDRAVVYSESVNAEALAEELAVQLAIELPLPPHASLLDTPNQCRWGEVQWQEWWLYNKPTEEQFCGLLLISPRLLEQDGFLNHFEESLKSLQKLQRLIS